MSDPTNPASPPTPTTTTTSGIENVPVLPLRDVVVYPHMVIPLFVGREKSIQALNVAMRSDKRIMLVAQKQATSMIRRRTICTASVRSPPFSNF